MKLLILADDLSGAADCALGFTRAGRRAHVLLHAAPELLRGAGDVLAVDTDTRSLPAAMAAERTVSAYRALHVPGQRLYKKIDSTLRGNWAAEVAALQPLAGMAIVAPSFPSVGRTVRNGQVYVNGLRLEDTATWKLECSGRDAGLSAQLDAAGLANARIDAEALRDEPDAIARLMARHAADGVQALVIDAQSEAALRALVQAAFDHGSPFFWVGSGGLAREIAAWLPRRDTVNDVGLAPRGPVLTVVGSLSAVSERQCAVLRDRCGLQEFVLSPDLLRAGHHHPEWSQISERIGRSIAGGQHPLLRIACEQKPDMAEAPRLSAALADLVAPHFASIGSLLATGGETARAILGRAGIARLRLIEEIEPGIPLSRVVDAAHSHQPCVVTKAGAFGSEQALYHAWQRLNSCQQDPPFKQGGQPHTP